jgi:GNAT superfamily N-acetyltransferase
MIAGGRNGEDGMLDAPQGRAGRPRRGAREPPILTIRPPGALSADTARPDVAPEPSDGAIREALELERQFVLTLGGQAIEYAGGTLVLHDKIPVPRFNFIQRVAVGRERQAGFFEHALDQYFQRALRPSIRVAEPAPAFVSASLLALGFRARHEPLTLFLFRQELPDSAREAGGARPARPEELAGVLALWTGDGERDVLRAAVEVAWHHPNPEEALTPWISGGTDRIHGGALVYRHRAGVGIYGVAVRPEARGRGSASALVTAILAGCAEPPTSSISIWSDSPRLDQRLRALGFEVARRFKVFELPEQAELALPPPGAAGPPRWRPPRRAT